ncbi:MAG: hypothetical protein V4721_07175 [Bacteroidota bacterium]
MNKSVLLSKISKPIGKKEAMSLAAENTNALIGVLDLCLHCNYEIAFRAAWILEIAAENNPEEFGLYLDEFTNVYINLRNLSGQRHFTKILMSLTKNAGRRDLLSEQKLAILVETTFEWLIDLQTPVAVRVNCMDILFNLKDKSDWIADELRAQIEFQLQNGSPALQSRGKRILNKLARNSTKSY